MIARASVSVGIKALIRNMDATRREAIKAKFGLENYWDHSKADQEAWAIDKSWEDEDASDEVTADVQFEETNRASCERDPGPGELRRRAQTERNDRTAKVNFICY